MVYAAFFTSSISYYNATKQRIGHGKFIEEIVLTLQINQLIINNKKNHGLRNNGQNYILQLTTL